MSSATNVIAEGEVLQLMNCNDPDISEDDYMQVIYSKTARLFEAASRHYSFGATPEQEKHSKIMVVILGLLSSHWRFVWLWCDKTSWVKHWWWSWWR